MAGYGTHEKGIVKKSSMSRIAQERPRDERGRFISTAKGGSKSSSRMGMGKTTGTSIGGEKMGAKWGETSGRSSNAWN